MIGPAGLTPLPRHLLESLYVNDKANFINSTRFSTDWVGLGPYKLTRWEPGSHLELDRFDDVPWLTSLSEARQKAAAEGKPILIWVGDGHPLGFT